MAGKPRINWVNYGIFIVNKNKAVKSAHLALALNETIKSENGFVPCNVLVYTAKMLGKDYSRPKLGVRISQFKPVTHASFGVAITQYDYLLWFSRRLLLVVVVEVRHTTSWVGLASLSNKVRLFFCGCTGILDNGQ